MREDHSQFPAAAVREAVINALVHADYSLSGTSIQIAVFQDRIEMTNPGALTFGQSLESALSGISKLRNRVIGRVFRQHISRSKTDPTRKYYLPSNRH